MAARRPRIGLNTTFERGAEGERTAVRPGYWRAVEQAGGLPVLLPQLRDPETLREALAMLDGFVLIGGYDIRAERWGACSRPEVVPMEPEREATDFALLDLLIESRKPTLAICLGCQELNVARGGTLYQHLPADAPASTVNHNIKTGAAPAHAVDVAPGSLLAGALGSGGRVEVNSRHHQGIATPGRGLTVTARAEDGLPEAVELEGHPFLLGVQWHPEDMAGDPRQENLFKSLVAASRKSGGLD